MSTVDYSKYTIDELFDVKANISPDSPNYILLLSELENRKDEIAEAVEKTEKKAFSLAENRVKIVGYFQIAAAVAILFYYVSSIFDGSASLLSTIVALPVIALNAIAGITAINENYKYYWLSILNQSLQIPSIALGSISASYSGLGGAYVYISWNTEFLFGATASFSPGFSFNQYTGSIPTQSISIDIVAIIFISALITVSEAKSTANKSLKQDK
ncbi:MAG: hypothetical protein ABJH06_13690 [Paraglaciecola sp.]|uniref:hypothetical protein n=1 Tax=Paraglaciecola sp. TaxID=1920173 RepID=UPI0032968C98